MPNLLSAALDPAKLLEAQGLTPDPWQRQVLNSTARELLLLCTRGAGKSRVVSALALHTALYQPTSLILLISKAQRQAVELFRYVKQGWHALQKPIPVRKETETQIEFANGSRIVCLPGKEETIRSFQGVRLLVLDEASRIPDDLYKTVRPMTTVSRGRIVALTTPFGRRGWFYDEWESTNPWDRVRITWRECPRYNAEFIDRERASMGDSWVRQEYECEFTALEGLVYPDFPRAVVDCWPLPTGRPVGGIDFGWRNPFAAVWGVLDRDDILWIGWERYLRETPLHEHARALPRSVVWYADPAGATEIAELRAAGLAVKRGTNDIAAGLAAVTARIQTGRLKVLSTACPNLISEAKLYRYPDPSERQRSTENPVDDHNHALAALRYLVSKLDAHFVARFRRKAKVDGAPPEPPPEPARDPLEAAKAVHARPWLRVDNDQLWRPL